MKCWRLDWVLISDVYWVDLNKLGQSGWILPMCFGSLLIRICQEHWQWFICILKVTQLRLFYFVEFWFDVKVQRRLMWRFQNGYNESTSSRCLPFFLNCSVQILLKFENSVENILEVYEIEGRFKLWGLWYENCKTWI